MNKQKIRLIRLFNGLDQKEFANEIGLSHSYIRQIESGQASINQATKAKIVRRFDISRPDFLKFEQDMDGLDG